MLKRKQAKSRGKTQFSQYFQEFKNGDKVAIIREHSLNPAFPIRIQGLVGTVSGKRGRAYIINIKEGGLVKMHIVTPANLKKLQ